MAPWQWLLAAVVALLWLLRPRRPAGYPPGPPLTPWLGNLRTQYQLLTRHVLDVQDELVAEYGSVVGLVLPFNVRIVLVRDFELQRRVFARAEFSGRPTLYGVLYRGFMKKQGLIFSEGALWSEHRRFALRQLGEMGFGKLSMEDGVSEEYERFAAELRCQAARGPVQMDTIFHGPIVNVLWRLVAGQRFDLHDPRLQSMIRTLAEFFQTVGPTNVVSILPWTRHLLPELSGFGPIRRHRDQVAGMFNALIDEHEATRDADAPRDFIDRFLAEMALPGAAARGFTRENLAVIGMDLFVAGGDTSATTLAWAALYLALWPAAQRRAQAELDAVVGRRRLPTAADRPALPFTQAVVHEVLRLSSIGYNSVPHYTSAGAAPIGPYTVPADTIVLCDIHGVHHDRAYWGDPERFRPERFLDAAGQLRREPRLVPFGVGRRQCLGEALARLELFVFLAGLLHQFRLEPLADEPPRVEPTNALLLSPLPFRLRVEWRTD